MEPRGDAHPMLIYRGVETLSGYMSGEGDGGGPHPISCPNMKQAAAASNRVLSQMNRTVSSSSSAVQAAANGLSGPAIEVGYSFLTNTAFSRGGSVFSYVAALGVQGGNFAADYSKATIQNAFIKAFLAGCP
jgi:hypothetical protein